MSVFCPFTKEETEIDIHSPKTTELPDSTGILSLTRCSDTSHLQGTKQMLKTEFPAPPSGGGDSLRPPGFRPHHVAGAEHAGRQCPLPARGLPRVGGGRGAQEAPSLGLRAGGETAGRKSAPSRPFAAPPSTRPPRAAPSLGPPALVGCTGQAEGGAEGPQLVACKQLKREMKSGRVPWVPWVLGAGFREGSALLTSALPSAQVLALGLLLRW